MNRVLRILVVAALLLAPGSVQAAGVVSGSANSPAYTLIGTKGNYAAQSVGPYGIYLSPNNVAGLTLGVDYSQTATIVRNSFPQTTCMQWKYPATPPSGVYGFMYLGWGDYYNTTPQTPITPFQVKDIGSLISYHTDVFGGAATNYTVIDDSYLTSTPGAATNHLFELEAVWRVGSATLQSFINGLTLIGTATFSGQTWTVRQNTTPNPPSFSVADIFFYRSDFADIPVGNFDYSAATAYLKAQGIITGLEYLNGMGHGGEPYINDGSLCISDFHVVKQ